MWRFPRPTAEKDEPPIVFRDPSVLDARVCALVAQMRIELVKSSAKDAEKAKQRDVSKAIALEKKLASAEGKCWHCFKSGSFKKHMMVALGELSYLALPLVSTHAPPRAHAYSAKTCECTCTHTQKAHRHA